MTKYGGSSVGAILVDGFNLIPSVIQDLGGPEIESILEVVTGLGDSWEQEQAVGVRKAQLSVEGYFDDATTGTVDALKGQEGVSRVVSLALHGNTLGAKATCFAGMFGAKWARIGKIAGLTRARATFSGSGQVDDDCTILYPLAVTGVDVNTEGASSQDAGASSAGGYAAYCHVLGYSGLTNVIVKVRHSPDDVTYADLTTFTTFTGNGAERKTGAGTVNRHTAVDINVTGAGVVTIFVALKRL